MNKFTIFITNMSVGSKYTEELLKINKSPHEKTNNVVSERVRHKPTCSASRDCYKLEILDLDSRGIELFV